VSRSVDDFVAYLAAKRSVDDRAIHRPTLDRLAAELDARATARGEQPVRILEVGFGIGTMLERLRDWNLLPAAVEYVGVDIDDTNIAAAADRLTNGDFEQTGSRQFALTGDDMTLTVELHAADAFEFAAAHSDPTAAEPQFDLLIGMAFLDIVPVAQVADTLLPLIAGGGVGYFPITFDGVTDLRPVDDPALTTTLLDGFHAAMDAPDRPGGSHTGRRLFAELPAAGAEHLAAGGADWVVAPTAAGYPGDEAVFLRHIVATIKTALLTETPAAAVAGVSDDAIRAWARQRHAQIDRETLVYLAHNIDHLVRLP
jgi:hypothetical protein